MYFFFVFSIMYFCQDKRKKNYRKNKHASRRFEGGRIHSNRMAHENIVQEFNGCYFCIKMFYLQKFVNFRHQIAYDDTYIHETK